MGVIYRLTSKLLLYRDLGNDGILSQLCNIFADFHNKKDSAQGLTDRIYLQVRRLLELAGDYGFDCNLWQEYLTFILLTDENPFSLAYERGVMQQGTLNRLAMGDFRIIKQLFHFDFGPIEHALGIHCFTAVSNYKSFNKGRQCYNANISKAVSEQINRASDENEIFDIVTGFYMENGVGIFGLNRAFRFQRGEFHPISNMDDVVLDDLIGYHRQKRILIQNTLSFVKGLPANNVLLYGDSGTGKSSSIKALVNRFYPMGLRMIELYKHQFSQIPHIISRIKGRNYYFIIFMDDLSFQEFETDYKSLKAVIEGGAETKPDNVLIYATSNRRHLIRETWSDREDMSSYEIHHSDTMQEKLSLVERFGITINYSKPSREEFFNIVTELARRHPEISLSPEELIAEAGKWEMWHKGVSGRTARQFVNYLAGKSAGGDNICPVK